MVSNYYYTTTSYTNNTFSTGFVYVDLSNTFVLCKTALCSNQAYMTFFHCVACLGKIETHRRQGNLFRNVTR